MATRTIGTELKLMGEKEFNDAMKGIDSNLKNIRADMNRVTAEYDGNANSMEALTAKESILKESIDQHRAKVDALQRMYDKQKDKYGENSAQADKYRLKLTNATTELRNAENALKKNNKAMADQKAAAEAAEKAEKEAAAAAEKLAREQKEAAEAAERLAHEEREAAEAAERAAQEQKRYEERLKKTEERAKKLKDGLGKLGSATAAVSKAVAAGVVAIGAAGGAALVGMVNLAKEAAEAARAAQEAGEELTASQQQWLAFADQMDTLRASATDAKGALASILLPALSQLSTEGTDFLNDFTKEMTAAAGDTKKQTEILGQYIGKGAKLILEKLPDYIRSGKELLRSVGQGLSENKDELLDLGQELLADFLNSVIDNAPKLAEGGLEMVLQMIEGIDGEDMADTAVRLVSRLVDSLADAAPELIPASVKLVGELAVGLIKNAPKLLLSGEELLRSVISGVLSAVGEIPEMWSEVFGVLIDAMRSSSSDSEIMQFGADVVEKIADGILGAWDWLVDWFNGLWDNLFSGKNVDVGVNAEASGAGIDGSHASGLRYVPFDGYLAELHRGEAVLPAAEAEAYRSGKTAGQKVFNLTINTKSLSPAEIDMLTEYMNRKLGDDL